MSWSEKPFIDYLNAVDDLLERVYGITTNDCGVEFAAVSQEAGETPAQCVRQMAEKYELQSLYQSLKEPYA